MSTGVATAVALAPAPETVVEPEKRVSQVARYACPRCFSESVYFSHTRGWVERALRQAGVRFCRCHRCSNRFLYV